MNFVNETAIVGGLVQKFGASNDDCNRTKNYLCMAFFSRNNKFDVAQITVPYNQTDANESIQKHEFARKLSQMKAYLLDINMRTTVAFNIKCIGRNGVYNENNYECIEFKKHFPGVATCGIMSDGEIGNDHMPRSKLFASGKLVLMGYASVFTFISVT
jgi:small ligand-binding sensory domain FIST